MLENYMHLSAEEQNAVETFAPLLEADPNGKTPNEAGAKLDAGKNRLGLVLCGFARALQEVGRVGTYGANKYTDNGWMEVPDGERRYTDAMLRHLMREATGEELDPDTGLHHAAHAAWNALARLDLALRKTPNVEVRAKVGAGKTAFEVHGTVFFKDNHQYRSQLRFPIADGAYELVKIENPDMTHPLFHVAGESFEVVPDSDDAAAMPPNVF